MHQYLKRKRVTNNFKYTLKTLDLEEFELPLFDNILPIEPSVWLQETLKIAEELPLTNEKSKSERIAFYLWLYGNG